MANVSMFFGYILKFFYNISNDYALSIVLFTILTRLILLPLTFSQMRSMTAMKMIQPEVDKINKKYKNDKQKQGMMLQQLYKENNVNPAAGCLPLLIQLPIIMAMYRVVQDPVKFVFAGDSSLYAAADRGFFWIKSLTDKDIINIGGVNLPFILPILSAGFTYLQMKMSSSKSSNSQGSEMAQSMNQSMTMMMPLMMLWWGLMFPAGLVLYWVTGTIVQVIQQYFIGKYEEKIMANKANNSSK
ncbi:MAG: YidC/Oxa1 family membrane protein insertase [Peptostreptococcaceae bacterium]|nr:YidC/Oxa1 family membrane protein insertase [Peptostreptococcaceae bacterium]